MSLLESVVQRNATRNPNRSRRLVGMMSADGRWVAATTMMPAARPRATRSRTQGLELFLLGVGADGGGEVGDLVDDAQDDVEPVGADDLAAAGGVAASAVAVVHLGLQTRAGGRGRRRMSLPTNTSATCSHRPSSTSLPSNSHSWTSVQRAAWAMIVFSSAGLAGAGFAAGEQVAVDQRSR